MLIFDVTGVLKKQIDITKGISTLIIKSSRYIDAFTNESLTLEVERSNGNNEVLATKVSLRDILVMQTNDDEPIQSDGIFNTVAVIELTPEGSIILGENEKIILTLESLLAGERYTIHGIEEPIGTDARYAFERKTVASEEVNKQIAVGGFDKLVMNTPPAVEEIIYTYENGRKVTFLPTELEALSCDIDPILAIRPDGTIVQRLNDVICLPLIAVAFIEIRKTQGTIINMTVRRTTYNN